jgi:hypothetical protein
LKGAYSEDKVEYREESLVHDITLELNIYILAMSCDSLRSIRISNNSGRELIAFSFSIADTIQMVAHDTVKMSSDPQNEYLLMVPDEFFYFHLHKPGLFGLTSPRTKLTTGYGYRLKSSELYIIQTLAGDANKGLSILRMNSDGEFESVETIAEYKFGGNAVNLHIMQVYSYI